MYIWKVVGSDAIYNHIHVLTVRGEEKLAVSFFPLRSLSSSTLDGGAGRTADLDCSRNLQISQGLNIMSLQT